MLVFEVKTRFCGLAWVVWARWGRKKWRKMKKNEEK